MLGITTRRNSYLDVLKPVSVLYVVYIAFFLSVFWHSNESAIGEYISSLASIAIMLVALIGYQQRIRVSQWKYILMIFTLAFSALLLIKGQGHYTILLYLKIVISIWFFSVFRLDRHDVIDFINRTYLWYWVVSVLVWVGVMPNVFYVPNYGYADYHVNFILFDFDILYGMEGSPANIDVYSAVILMLNLFMNETKSKKLYLWISIFAILASFRLTPIVAILAVMVMYPIYKKSRGVALAILLSISLLFTLLLIGLHFDATIKIFGEDMKMQLIAYVATHARSMIWVQQLDIMIEKYSWFDYILGRFATAEFTVPTYQIEGGDAGIESLNPHNNYLLLLFRSPLLLCIFMAIFLIAQYKTFSNKTFPVVLMIFLASFSNSSLIGLGNPVYLLFIVYVATQASNGLSAKSRKVRGGAS